jgi:hypothetical protein
LTRRVAPTRLKDPEPVSLALALFAAITGGVGVAMQWGERRRGRGFDRGVARAKLLAADRVLNRLDEAYRSLISVFDQEGLLATAPFSPGRSALLADSRLRAELDRIRRTGFDTGRELERTLDELGAHLADSDAIHASRLASEVEGQFRATLQAYELTDFLYGVGLLIKELSEFLENVARDLEVELPSSRLGLLMETLSRLDRYR